MAILTNIAPNPTPSQLLDDQGRAIEYLPAEIGRTLLRVDDLLSSRDLKFNIECPTCSAQMQRPVYVMPVERGGRVEFLCPHARRISDVSAQ